MIDKVHDKLESKFKSMVKKAHAINEFDVEDVLGLTDDAISGAKITRG